GPRTSSGCWGSLPSSEDSFGACSCRRTGDHFAGTCASACFRIPAATSCATHPTGVNMPVIKVTDIAWGRLRSPDLDTQEEFLTRFGLITTERTATALYMRGTDPLHHIHVTEKGDPKFVGFAYHAASEDDLHRLAKAPGASAVEEIDEPGGGKRVRLTEP